MKVPRRARSLFRSRVADLVEVMADSERAASQASVPSQHGV